MNKRVQSGQILVLVLLVVLVGLTIGLSIASRTLSNLRDTSNLDQSNRAFSAAEAGVEKALTLLKDNPHACDTGGACNASIDRTTNNVVVSPAGGDKDIAVGNAEQDRDSAFPLNLTGYTGGTIDIYWGKTGENADCAKAEALVVSIVYQQGSDYGLAKKALDACASSHGNGFDAGSVDTNPTNTLQFGQDVSQSGYGFRTTLNVAAGGGFIPAGATVQLARLRLMYGDPTEQIAVAPSTGNKLGAQGQYITSTAVSGGKQRTVKVFRSDATLPAIFDYALFNGSTEPLTK